MKEVAVDNSSANGIMNGVRATRQLRSRVGSGAESPRSLDTPRLRPGSALSSPLRSSRQRSSSPGEDLSEDSGIRMHRTTYQSMYQDVINIKALLLRLSRHLQESENDETTQKNGFYNPSGDLLSDKRLDVSQQEMIADLQRQIRPLSTGPILSTQPDAAGGSLVSNSTETASPPTTAIPRPQPSLIPPPPSTRCPSRLPHPQWRRATSPSLTPSSLLYTELHKPLLPVLVRKQT